MANYQLYESGEVLGWEPEVTDGTDAATGRLDWIGQVLSINFTEDYEHQDYQPIGSGPDPHFVLKKKEQFEIEVESFVSTRFADIEENELLSYVGGQVEVDLIHAVPSGGDATVTVGETLTGQTSTATGVITATNGTTTTTVRMTSVAQFQAAETMDTSGDADTVVLTTATPSGVVNLRRPLRTFTMEWGVTDPSNPWYHLVTGCKINSATFTFRPDDLIMLRLNIMGRAHTAGTSVVTCSPGDDLDVLTVSTNPPAHMKHMTLTLADYPIATATTPTVTEMDITITNNITAVWGDNQQYYPDCLIEGKRRATFNMTVKKLDEVLATIRRTHPQGEVILTHGTPAGGDNTVTVGETITGQSSAATGVIIETNGTTQSTVRMTSTAQFQVETADTSGDADTIAITAASSGKLAVTVLVNQLAGWYMNLGLATCTLEEMTRDFNEEVQEGFEEQYAGVMVGPFTLDMKV